MVNRFERQPIPSSPEGQDKEKKIEIIEPIGARKRTPEEIERAKRIREGIEEERLIKGKLKEGKLLSKEEAAFLREIELTRKVKEKEKEKPKEEEKEKMEEEKLPEEKKVSEETLEKKEEKPKEEEEKDKTAEEPETKKEKSREEIEKELEIKRTDYANTYTEYRKAFKGMKEKELKNFETIIEPARKFIEIGDKENFIKELKEKGIKDSQAEAIYNVEIKETEYSRAKEQLTKELEKQGVEKIEIFKRLILNERELLHQAKVESWPPKEKNILRKGIEWYMRQGTATRLLISTGLVTGVVAVAGGFSAPAIAMFAGYRYLRGAGAVLAGKIAGQGVEWAMAKGIKAKEEADLEQLRTGFDLNKLKEAEKELEKIFEEAAKRERRKLLIKGVTMAAVGAGTAIGLGMLEQSWTARPIVSTEAPSETPPKPGVIIPEEVKPEAVPAPVVENIVEVQKGDSVWKMAESQLESHYGDKFISLNEARKTYIIDAIKDKVAENPEKFGLENIDKLKIGQKIDFSSIFEDKAGIEKIFANTDVLTQEQIASIKHNNQTLETWLKEHPGEKLTSERVEEILSKAKAVPAPEVITPEVPAEVPLAAEVVPPPAEEAPLKPGYESIKIMEANEIANVRAIGFSEGEYEAIKNLTVGKLLEEIPAGEKNIRDLWRSEESIKIDLPHHGRFYDVFEFRRHAKLAEFIRSFEPSGTIKEITIKDFLRMVGPKGKILL